MNQEPVEPFFLLREVLLQDFHASYDLRIQTSSCWFWVPLRGRYGLKFQAMHVQYAGLPKYSMYQLENQTNSLILAMPLNESHFHSTNRGFVPLRLQ